MGKTAGLIATAVGLAALGVATGLTAAPAARTMRTEDRAYLAADRRGATLQFRGAAALLQGAGAEVGPKEGGPARTFATGLLLDHLPELLKEGETLGGLGPDIQPPRVWSTGSGDDCRYTPAWRQYVLVLEQAIVVVPLHDLQAMPRGPLEVHALGVVRDASLLDTEPSLGLAYLLTELDDGSDHCDSDGHVRVPNYAVSNLSVIGQRTPIALRQPASGRPAGRYQIAEAHQGTKQDRNALTLELRPGSSAKGGVVAGAKDDGQAVILGIWPGAESRHPRIVATHVLIPALRRVVRAHADRVAGTTFGVRFRAASATEPPCIVASVGKGTAAARTEVRAGDRIVEIDGSVPQATADCILGVRSRSLDVLTVVRKGRRVRVAIP